MNFFKRPTNQKNASPVQTDGPIDIKTKPVYYVTCDKDSTVLIAMELCAFRENGKLYVRWFDTNHDRVMMTDNLRIGPDGSYLEFHRTEGENADGIYRFVPMTLEVYHEHVQKRLYNGVEFDSEEALIEAFLKTME